MCIAAAMHLQIGVWLTAWVKLRDVCVFTAPFFAGNTVGWLGLRQLFCLAERLFSYKLSQLLRKGYICAAMFLIHVVLLSAGHDSLPVRL
jgi:hypothetical protein